MRKTLQVILSALLVPVLSGDYLPFNFSREESLNDRINTAKTSANLDSETNSGGLERITSEPDILYANPREIQTNPGYKPVADECPNIPEGEEPKFDNHYYKEWCERTFKHGNHIYEAYKAIATLKYTPEAAKTDFWQTSFETAKSKKGDCEDAVFLFFSHLLPNQENAEIVWGWVIDRRIGVAKAHVWYQLKGVDEKGEEEIYVVEGFTNDWNGIVPKKVIKQTESRKPIFTLPHLEASRLASMISKSDSWETYQLLADLHGATEFYAPMRKEPENPGGEYTLRHDSKSFRYPSMSRTYNTAWEFSVSDRMAALLSKEKSKIFGKLHELFTRYERQKEKLASDRQKTIWMINNEINSGETYTGPIQTGKDLYSRKDLKCRR